LAFVTCRLLPGWTPWLRVKVRAQAAAILCHFLANKP
jgi:hypothetical protein